MNEIRSMRSLVHDLKQDFVDACEGMMTVMKE